MILYWRSKDGKHELVVAPTQVEVAPDQSLGKTRNIEFVVDGIKSRLWEGTVVLYIGEKQWEFDLDAEVFYEEA